MKNLIPFFAILLFIGTLNSCEKSFLNLTPEDSESGSTFYKTPAQFNQALTAAYTPLRDVINYDFYTAEMRTDNTHYEYYAVDRGTANSMREDISDFTDQSTNNYSNGIYFYCYHGISLANIVIGRIASAQFADSIKNVIVGEAKFLRAWYYFRLVRYFGDVPLYLKETTNAEDAFLPRTSSDSVYAQIILDAKDAIANLAPPAKFPQTGHATKGSATMLLADVYMTQKKYALAQPLLESLGGMGYQLMADYASVFSTANKNSRESIFEVQYMQGVQGGQQSNFIYQFLPRSANVILVTGIKGTNSGTGGWNTPTQDLIRSYEPNDKRLDASIGVVEGTYDASDIFTITANKSILNYTPAVGKIGVPYIKKYLNPSVTLNNTDDDWPIYRYSDALLLLAVSLNEQGKGIEALPYLNEVRTRAGLPPITTTNTASLRDIILHERRIELAFENHRWFDLLRAGKVVEVLSAYGADLKKQNSYLTSDTYNVTTDRLLYPIPASEIGLNTSLTQNPGY